MRNKIERIKNLFINIRNLGAKVWKGAIQVLFVSFLVVGCTGFTVSTVILTNNIGKKLYEVRDAIQTGWRLRKVNPVVREKAVKSALKVQEEINARKEIAKKEALEKYFNGNGNEAKAEEVEKEKVDLSRLRILPKRGKERLVWVTGYNNKEEQTDATPNFAEPSRNNLAALYKPLREKGLCICASNYHPLGTILQIRSNEGTWGKCIVLDKMRRNHKGVDIYFDNDLTRARKFGRQKLFVKKVGQARGFKAMAPNPN